MKNKFNISLDAKNTETPQKTETKKLERARVMIMGELTKEKQKNATIQIKDFNENLKSNTRNPDKYFGFISLVSTTVGQQTKDMDNTDSDEEVSKEPWESLEPESLIV